MVIENSALDIDALFRQYQAKVYAYALHHLGNSVDAEDAVSRVFLQAQKHKGSYDASRSAPSTWLYAITRNETRMVLRGRRRDRVVPGLDSGELLSESSELPETYIIQEELLERLADAMEKLAERERDILLLRFYSGLSSKEVAARMGLSNANVRYLQTMALRRLRKLIGEP